MTYIDNPQAYEQARTARIQANARTGRARRWYAEDPTRQQVADFLHSPACRGEFLSKMLESLDDWGSLTPAQEAAVRKIMAGDAERNAQRAAEAAAAAPVPVSTERMVVEGTILTIKEVIGHFGPQIKMLVKHSTGWKVWGTMPARLAADKGDTVRFEAKVEVSKDDPKFGFYSRPSKPEVVSRATPAAQ